MSGFVAVFGKLPDSALKKMIEAITHRGPHFSGSWRKGNFTLFQNYLRADIGGNLSGNFEIPMRLDGDLAIGFDGQLAELPRLMDVAGVENGPFAQERALLNLRAKNADVPGFLNDGIYSFVLSDGRRMLAARDLLGIKTLFYSATENATLIASELKALTPVTEKVYEFPPGHTMDENGALKPFARLPEKAPPQSQEDVEKIVETVRSIIGKRIDECVDFSLPTASLLSGGLDSSVIAYLSNQRLRESGNGGKLRTFSIGVEESEDIRAARVMSKYLDSDHTELVVGLDRIVEVLPEVIHYLESFDPSLVRSSVSNYLISQAAKEQGIEILLSGEGGDEIFCGYTYLKGFREEELFGKQIDCLSPTSPIWWQLR